MQISARNAKWVSLCKDWYRCNETLNYHTPISQWLDRDSRLYDQVLLPFDQTLQHSSHQIRNQM